jgi:hypothetical protein
MHQIEIVILIVAIILLYIQPYVLIRNINTFIGRVISIIILVLASLYSTLSGIVVAMIIVVFTDANANAIYEGMAAQLGIQKDNLKRGSVTDDLLDSTSDTNTLGQNLLEHTTSGASIIGDTPGSPIGSAATDLKGGSSSSIIFSNIPSTANFRKNHCRGKMFVNEKGKEMKIADIKKKFPLNFTNGIDCNPCDETCSYTITDSVEQLHNEENLRPKQASMFM